MPDPATELEGGAEWSARAPGPASPPPDPPCPAVDHVAPAPLGLSLAQAPVVLHGDDSAAHGAGPGLGSELTVRLPIAGDAAAMAMALAMANPAAPPPTPGADQVPPRPDPAEAPRLLIADDNADVVESLALLLGLCGYAVERARDGVEAVEQAARHRPDVVLLDIGMPRLDGYDACRRIRALPDGASMLIIALTGWGQDEDRHRSDAAGFDDHLVKPVDPAALLALLAGRRRRPG